MPLIHIAWDLQRWKLSMTSVFLLQFTCAANTTTLLQFSLGTNCLKYFREKMFCNFFSCMLLLLLLLRPHDKSCSCVTRRCKRICKLYHQFCFVFFHWKIINIIGQVSASPGHSDIYFSNWNITCFQSTHECQCENY